MNPQDDPEARIRALEPTEQGSENPSYTPPPLPPPTQQWPGAPGYGQSPYGADPYGTGYLPPYPPVPPHRPALRPWLVLGAIFVVFLALAGVAVAFVLGSHTSTPGVPAVSGGGDVLTDEPGAPVLPSLPTLPSIIEIPGAQQPSNSLPEPGSTVTVSGIGVRRSVACNDNVIIISGATNTVDITGHCTAVTVSGFDNGVTVESAAEISVSGFDNTVTYRTGTPQVNESGSGNSIDQG